MTTNATRPVFAILSSLVEERAGLHYSAAEQEVFLERVTARCQELGFESLLDYYYFLRYDAGGPAELEQLVAYLVVNETYFFRELDALKVIVSRFVEPLVRSGHTPRIWSAACSTGEEPLTLAMLLARAGLLSQVELVASDISERVLAHARAGSFGKRSLRHAVEPELANRWLREERGRLHVAPELIPGLFLPEGVVSHSSPVRVLVVDDSAFARRVLRQALEAQPNVEVVGIAADGLEALEKIEMLKPDVVTLDLMMPHLDGVGVLRELGASASAPRVVVVSFSDEESDLVVQALQLGAVDFVKKPTALATDRLYELSAELVRKVAAAAGAKVSLAPPAALLSRPALQHASSRRRLLVIGTSTGGPQALTRLLALLPEDLPVPVAIALHIPGEYTEALAKRLDEASPLHILEARDGIELQPGMVVLAKGGWHLEIDRSGETSVARLTRAPESKLYVPSVDLLFQSAARTWGAQTLGVVLTGMGDDGLAGARAIVSSGGEVLTEAEASCVIYGMPRCVREAGLSAEEVPLEEMATAILRRLA